MNPKYILIAKAATKLVVGSSVSKVVTTHLKTVTPAANKLEAAQLAIGVYAIVGMVTSRAIAWAGSEFDEAVETIDAYKAAKEAATQ